MAGLTVHTEPASEPLSQSETKSYLRVDSSGETVPFIEKSVMPYYFEGDPKILLAICLSAVGFFIVYALNRQSTKN